jgi:hypothetical protein
MVERIKGEKWEVFRDRYGDWGRDLVLWAGRCFAGLKLRELGAQAGRVDYSSVGMGIRRLESRARRDRNLRSAMKRLTRECAL